MAVTVCFPFSGDSIGGSHISVHGLLKHLDRSRFRAVIVPEVPGGQIAQFFTGTEQLPDPGSTGLFIPGEAFTLRKFAQGLHGILPRVRFLRENRVDIVHVNDGRTSANWALAARLAGAKLVWHHRGDPTALGLRLVAPALANRVITVSSFALPRPGIWSAANKAEVAHSPFDTDIHVDRAAARAELGISADTLVLGYFGAFVPRKRPLIFVDMLAELRAKTDRPFIGLMFGEVRVTAMADALRARIIEKDVFDHVRLMGYKNPGTYWIAACDRLIVPAVNEPFGRTLVEAMLVGTPVIAARSGGNIEALDRGLGILVPPDDPAALADAALAPAPMTEAAQTDARHRFSEATHCAKVSAVYDRLLTPRNAPSIIPDNIMLPRTDR